MDKADCYAKDWIKTSIQAQFLLVLPKKINSFLAYSSLVTVFSLIILPFTICISFNIFFILSSILEYVYFHNFHLGTPRTLWIVSFLPYIFFNRYWNRQILMLWQYSQKGKQFLLTIFTINSYLQFFNRLILYLLFISME